LKEGKAKVLFQTQQHRDPEQRPSVIANRHPSEAIYTFHPHLGLPPSRGKKNMEVDYKYARNDRHVWIPDNRSVVTISGMTVLGGFRIATLSRPE
jgi:hypothetical protein